MELDLCAVMFGALWWVWSLVGLDFVKRTQLLDGRWGGQRTSLSLGLPQRLLDNEAKAHHQDGSYGPGAHNDGMVVVSNDERAV